MNLKNIKYIILDMDGCCYHPKYLRTLFGQVSSRMTDFISLKLGIEKDKAKKIQKCTNFLRKIHKTVYFFRTNPIHTCLCNLF